MRQTSDAQKRQARAKKMLSAKSAATQREIDAADLRRKVAEATPAARKAYQRWLKAALQEQRRTKKRALLIASEIVTFEKVPAWCWEAAALLQHATHGNCSVSVEVVESEHSNILYVHLDGRVRAAA
ncbi:MAG: hypothetical protein QY323_03480 [Patescibacteria group bacterium]|nr:MAG: hypothetical protein QY323_03480 [Patescibacteria group bacterium]